MLDKSKGLTSSEASRVKNFLKEMVKSIGISDTLPLITSTAVRNHEDFPLDQNEKIEDLRDKLHTKARYYSLSTWLGEAIAYKDRLLLSNQREAFNGDNVKMLELPATPIKPPVDWASFFSTLSVKDQSDYLINETYATHIGKFVHNFDAVRETYDNFRPTRFEKISDVETLTVKNKLIYSKEELIEDFETLQAEHRKANQIVNYWKAKHKEWVAKIEMEHMDAVAKYGNDYKAIQSSNQNTMNSALAEFNKLKVAKNEEIAAMKIVIPTSLQSIVDEVMAKFER